MPLLSLEVSSSITTSCTLTHSSASALSLAATSRSPVGLQEDQAVTRQTGGLVLLFCQASFILCHASPGFVSKATCVFAYDLTIHCRCLLQPCHLFLAVLKYKLYDCSPEACSVLISLFCVSFPLSYFF